MSWYFYLPSCYHCTLENCYFMHPWRTNPNRAWPERKWQRCVTSDNSPVTLYSIRLEIFFSICISTAGENHLWPLLRLGIHQSVHRVSFSRGPQGKRQVQPTQVLFVQGEICWSWCVEAENATSRKNTSFYSLFQGLFRNFNDAFIPLLQPHMERLVADTHESKQRCVSEIISGLIRGCKHWSYLKACVNLPNSHEKISWNYINCVFKLGLTMTYAWFMLLQLRSLWVVCVIIIEIMHYLTQFIV